MLYQDLKHELKNTRRITKLIENILLRLGSFLRNHEHRHGYPIRLNRIVAFIERITNVLILTDAEANDLFAMLGEFQS